MRVDDFNTIFQSAVDAFDRDHPEVFWIWLNEIKVSYDDIVINGRKYVSSATLYIPALGKYSKQEVLKRDTDYMLTCVNNILSSAQNLSQYDKLRIIHDYLVLDNDYNTNEEDAYISRKAISALHGSKLEYKPVCEGYSRAFKVLCDKNKIPCILISGEGVLNQEKGPHMWNYVMLDGHWYIVDVTWDDPILGEGMTYEQLSKNRKYKFFLVGSNFTQESHQASGMFADKENYNFVFRYPLINYANFDTPTEYHSISYKNLSGGTIRTNAEQLNGIQGGSRIEVFIIPDSGMELVSGTLKCNDEVIVGNSFVMPDEDAVITAKFMKSDIVNVSNVTKTLSSREKSFDGEAKSSQSLKTQKNKPQNTNIKNSLDTHSVQTSDAENKKSSANAKKYRIDNKQAENSEQQTRSVSCVISDENKANLEISQMLDKDIKNEAVNNYGYYIDSSNGFIYQISNNIFNNKTIIEIKEKPEKNKQIENILDKKYSNLSALDTYCFSVNTYNQEGQFMDFDLKHDQNFTLLVPIDALPPSFSENSRLYYIDGEKIVVVNASINTLKDGRYFQINVEKSGDYIVIKENDNVYKDDLLMGNVTSKKNTMMQNVMNIILFFVIIISCATTLIFVKKDKKDKKYKKETTDNSNTSFS